MKCDELEAEQWLDYAGEPMPCYPKSEVDEAIAELKARIDDLEKLNHNLCERVTENDEIRLHWEEIEQTRAENESLKAQIAEAKELSIELQKRNKAIADNAIGNVEAYKLKRDAEIESLKYSHYAEMVDAGMRERRLKRALYKACANWALAILAWVDYIDQGESRKWSEMRRKCLKKAEEYK